MTGTTPWYEPGPKLRVSIDCKPLDKRGIKRNHMVATRIQLRSWYCGAVVALLAAGAGLRGIPASAVETPRKPEPASVQPSTQLASSTAGDSSPVWIASDFAAIALMGLGATIVFLPLPRLRSRKASASAVRPVEAVPTPLIVDPVQPIGDIHSSPKRAIGSSA